MTTPAPQPTKTDLPFARAYDFILADPNLIPAEKMVLFQVLRYFPRPCTQRRATIARAIGLRADYVRTLVRWLCAGPDELRRMGRPPRCAYLRQGYVRAGDTGEKIIRWLAPADGLMDGESVNTFTLQREKSVNKFTPEREHIHLGVNTVPPIEKNLKRKLEEKQRLRLACQGQASPQMQTAEDIR